MDIALDILPVGACSRLASSYQFPVSPQQLQNHSQRIARYAVPPTTALVTGSRSHPAHPAAPEANSLLPKVQRLPVFAERLQEVPGQHGLHGGHGLAVRRGSGPPLSARGRRRSVGPRSAAAQRQEEREQVGRLAD